MSAACAVPECLAPTPEDRIGCGRHYPKIRLETLQKLNNALTYADYNKAELQAIAEMRGER